ncbi:GdmH [Streptococcus criceti]|uniref:Membrane protein n=1 Tax=Streptococcus criceti HS-6 TaxID=873449 RepID=G5JPS2_STRCG|nr:YdcF family protein [Streptococcus criceti]EHI74037.1 putative membrane protein [Streptococcus criceti HS-6]SUN43234.1 GdmH [Streptococcus criceti]
MTLYALTAVVVIWFIISFKIDRRKLSNAFLFLFSLGLLFLSFAYFAYERQWETIHGLFILFVYGFIPVSLMIFATYMIINGILILRKERKSLANSLSIFFGIGILFYLAMTILYVRYWFRLYVQNSMQGYIAQYSYIILSFFFIVFLFIFFAFLAYSILYLTLPKNKDYDYIIIHGSGLIEGYKIPPLLASRIDKAIEAYRAATKDDVRIIASGGKGRDEIISEARAIADYLIAKGIKEDRIILEEQSTSTYENLKFSQELTRGQKENPKYLFVSNNYHVFRATLYARRLHMDGEGVGAKTAGYYIPSAFLREYLAILNKIKGILIVISVVFLLLVYFSLK